MKETPKKGRKTLVIGSKEFKKAVEEHLKKHGEVTTIRSEKFKELQEGCPVCRSSPKITFNAPNGGKRGKCLFCDCPADMEISQWHDEYKRFGVLSSGWLEVPICYNCLEHYLEKDKFLDFGSLLTDSGAV